jgi:murein DD-endopeptidase MepM/ murein hydrolase activator NlpD
MKHHNGMDIPAPEGTEVHSVGTGTVLFSGEQRGYGNVVVIDHNDGYLAKYAHNKTNLVQQGQEVEAGSVIAEVGSTGRSTGPHVHFEVRCKGEPVHPDTLLALKKD